MEIGYTAEQEELRTRLREYYEKLLDADTVAELSNARGIGGPMRAIWKQMCADGWAGHRLAGGVRRPGSLGDRTVRVLRRVDARPVHRCRCSRSTASRPRSCASGAHEQKQFFLPKILAGDIHFCIGYSEPGAGTDLASLTTRAVRDGDEYVINGQKMWTSLAVDADYCWLAVRTNPEVKKHQGISLIILPMDTPGITVAPLDLLVDHNVNQVFLDDVRVPVDNCVGGENNGWTLITNQLNHERVTLCASGTPGTGARRGAEVGTGHGADLASVGRVIDLEWVRLNLARVHAKVEVLRLMNWQVAWEATQGVLDIGHCSSVKVYGTESNLDSWRLLMEVLGAVAYLKPDAPGAVLRSRLEAMYRGTLILTFGGGTNESQRDLISQFSLGLPRANR